MTKRTTCQNVRQLGSRLQKLSGETALYRKRPNPLMQKRVAVRYGFKCALCGRLLDDTWETDHIVPLTEAKSFEDAERLNAIENLQPVHRACHQIKTSREAR